jgi:hypothetical protein
MPLQKSSFAMVFNELDTGFRIPKIESSGISLLGTKSNQQVLSLANTEGGQAQSLLVGPGT